MGFMEGWDHFGALPVYVGSFGILMTLGRFWARDCIARKSNNYKERKK